MELFRSARQAELTKLRSRKACPVAHHQFEKPCDHRQVRKREHPEFGRSQQMVERIRMAAGVQQILDRVSERGDSKQPPGCGHADAP